MGKNASTRLLRRASVDESPFSNYGSRSLRNLFPNWNLIAVDFITQCLRMDPDARPNCSNLLQHSLFQHDGFSDKFLIELQNNVAKETAMNHLLMKREEARRLSVLSIEEPPRNCRSGTGRFGKLLISI